MSSATVIRISDYSLNGKERIAAVQNGRAEATGYIFAVCLGFGFADNFTERFPVKSAR